MFKIGKNLALRVTLDALSSQPTHLKKNLAAPSLGSGLMDPLLIIWAAKSRARTSSTSKTKFSQILKKKFKTQKELYITPAVIILAALPQLIFTSSFSCRELNPAWQRYALLIAYLFSFIPQICGFLIFVLPSSSYKAEFINTRIGRRLFCMKRNNQNDDRMR